MKRPIEDVMKEIDQELLKKLFYYDPISGVLKRIGRLTSSGKVLPCDFVGKATSIHGYYQYTVKDYTFDAHKLIWMLVTGTWPAQDIDHINGDRRDNRWSNLREVSRTYNLRNVGKKTEPKHGHVGIYPLGKKWRASIGAEQKAGFATKEEAIARRVAKEKELGYGDNHYKREVWNGKEA